MHSARSLALAFPLLALGLLGCGDDTSGNATSNPSCGTADAPDTLKVTDVSPAPGASVVDAAIVHSLTVVDAPGLFESFSFQFAASHTAGDLDPASLSFTVTAEGKNLHYEAGPASFSVAPGHVEFSNTQAYQAEDGCVYAFPTPLFSYDVTPAEAD